MLVPKPTPAKISIVLLGDYFFDEGAWKERDLTSKLSQSQSVRDILG